MSDEGVNLVDPADQSESLQSQESVGQTTSAGLVFHEDSVHNTFGLMTKKGYKPLSDFKLDLVHHLVFPKNPLLNGFVVRVTPESYDFEESEVNQLWEERLCYVTTNSLMKRETFLRDLNQSYRFGSLGGLFTDKELAGYIGFKKRQHGPFRSLQAVTTIGMQDNGTWALNKDLLLNNEGNRITAEQSGNMWVSHLCSAVDGPELVIATPLGTAGLTTLLREMEHVFGDNLAPALFVMGAAAMCLQYKRMVETFSYCPIPLAFGDSGAGKTTALRCALSLWGGARSHFYSRTTREWVLQKCAQGTIPLGVDDPSSKREIEQLVMDLFNGAISGNVSKGEKNPITTTLITANFNLANSVTDKYVSRCILIKFGGKALSSSVMGFARLHNMMNGASSAIGAVIGIGNQFFERGMNELSSTILPELQDDLPDTVLPRVIPGYGTLLWFTKEVLKVADCSHLLPLLDTYVLSTLVDTVSKYQTRAILDDQNPPAVHAMIHAVSVADAFGSALLDAVRGKQRQQIFIFARGHTRHLLKDGGELPAMALMLTAQEVRCFDAKVLSDLKNAVAAGILEGKLQAARQFLKRNHSSKNPFDDLSRTSGQSVSCRCAILPYSIFSRQIAAELQSLFMEPSRQRDERTISESSTDTARCMRPGSLPPSAVEPTGHEPIGLPPPAEPIGFMPSPVPTGPSSPPEPAISRSPSPVPTGPSSPPEPAISRSPSPVPTGPSSPPEPAISRSPSSVPTGPSSPPEPAISRSPSPGSLPPSPPLPAADQIPPPASQTTRPMSSQVLLPLQSPPKRKKMFHQVLRRPQTRRHACKVPGWSKKMDCNNPLQDSDDTD